MKSTKKSYLLNLLFKGCEFNTNLSGRSLGAEVSYSHLHFMKRNIEILHLFMISFRFGCFFLCDLSRLKVPFLVQSSIRKGGLKFSDVILNIVFQNNENYFSIHDHCCSMLSKFSNFSVGTFIIGLR